MGPGVLGVRPAVVLKGGALVLGALGDPNASIPTPQPCSCGRPWHPVGADVSVSFFVAPAALADGLADRLSLRRKLEAVRVTRSVGKAQMVHNDALPRIEVDPETFAIRIDGDLVNRAPAVELPLAQRYQLF